MSITRTTVVWTLVASNGNLSSASTGKEATETKSGSQGNRDRLCGALAIWT